MKNNIKIKKFILLIFILLSVFYIQTIAYSALSATLNITGDAVARVAADVRITGFRIASTTNNGVSNYEEFGKNHIITGLQLPSRNATVTYYVEITNYGSSDVGIYSISGLPSNLTYTIKNYTLKDKICDDTGKCNGMIKKTYEITLKTSIYTWTGYTGDVKLNFDFRVIHKVTYEGITNNNYPTGVIDGDSLKITFRENLNRVLITSNGTQLGYYSTVTNGQTITINNITSDIIVSKKPQVAKVVRGSLDSFGSEICIEEECFYLLYSDSNSTWIFPKYNLHVGWSVGNYAAIGGASNVNKLSYPTGKQDPTALGATYDARDQFKMPWIGVIGFSANNYWWNKDTGSANSGYSIDISSDGYNIPYVYNSSSNLYSPFNNYKSYLEGLGVEITTIRTFKGSELISMGCDLANTNCLYPPDWIRSTTYWIGNAYNDYVMFVSPTHFNFWPYGYVDFIGVRPLIEIPTREINPTPDIQSQLSIKSGDLNTMGSEICIGTECFYVMYNDSTNVTLMAKYNLEVGYKVTGWNSSTGYTKYKITNASGKQSSTAGGVNGTYETAQFPFIGTTAYSPDIYWVDETGNFKTSITQNYIAEGEGYRWIYNSGSEIYEYIENYRTYLESLGVVINHARIVSATELNWMACQYSENCDDIPSFTYSTSYWTGTGNETTVVGMFKNIGLYTDSDITASSEFLGVRPVITIPVGYFN